MEATLVGWVGTVLAAKFFAGLTRREFGLAPDVVARRRGGLTVDVAYLWLLLVFICAVRWVGVDAGLLIAIAMRVGTLLSTRALIAANHYFIEFLAMVVCLRLDDTPLALAAAIQLMALSVWLYAACQKLYHGEFADGSFFYIVFQDNRPPRRWPGMARWVGRIDGDHAVIDRAGLRLCRRLAVMALLTEIVMPIVAMSLNGTWWGVLVFAGASGIVGIMSGETSFMITNLALAALFVLPFDLKSLQLVMNDPISTAIVGYCLVWPAVHAVMTRRLHISSWKLSGWGMYATTLPRVSLIGPIGELVPQTIGSAPLAVLETFGACKLAWVRAYAQRVFLQWHPNAHNVKGFVFQWYRRRGMTFVTNCLVFPNTNGAVPWCRVLDDEASVTAFRAYVSSFRAADEVDREPASQVPQLHLPQAGGTRVLARAAN